MTKPTEWCNNLPRSGDRAGFPSLARFHAHSRKRVSVSAPAVERHRSTTHRSTGQRSTGQQSTGPHRTDFQQPELARPNLTVREIEVLICWLHCDSKTAVASDLYLSLGTVNTHLTRIRSKYAAVGRAAPTKASLVARALQDGLIDISEL